MSLHIGRNIPDKIEIDDGRLTQILVNIIGNAVKFTPSLGKVDVKANFYSNGPDCDAE